MAVNFISGEKRSPKTEVYPHAAVTPRHYDSRRITKGVESRRRRPQHCKKLGVFDMKKDLERAIKMFGGYAPPPAISTEAQTGPAVGARYAPTLHDMWDAMDEANRITRHGRRALLQRFI